MAVPHGLFPQKTRYPLQRDLPVPKGFNGLEKGLAICRVQLVGQPAVSVLQAVDHCIPGKRGLEELIQFFTVIPKDPGQRKPVVIGHDPAAGSVASLVIGEEQEFVFRMEDDQGSHAWSGGNP